MARRSPLPGPSEARASRHDEPVPLARLFSMAIRALIDDLHARLARRGFPGVRPSFGFVLLAARDRPITAKDVAELLGFTKQAATKLLAAMQDDGLLEEGPAPSDGRTRPLQVSRTGRKLLSTVERIYAELEGEWARELGAAELERVRRNVTRVLRARHDGALPPVRPTW